ncbi:MAG: ATP synthase F1 subunit delta [Deltaproteobacteria bacterium]|nr:ATP synthase F1 subunit delta [Deltaproteobacteria bacterium]
MIEGSLGKRYGKALLRIAITASQVEEILAELESLNGTFLPKAPLTLMLGNPAISIREKKEVLEKIIQQVGLSRAVGNLLRILLERKRSYVFSSVVREYRNMADEHLGRVRAMVHLPMATQVGDLGLRLEKILKKKVLLKQEQDASLLGGIMIKIGDQVFDGSLKAQLNKLRSNVEKVAL